jgi:hypothetical protein
MAPEVAPQERAVWAVREQIRRIARDVHGALFVETSIEGCQVLTCAGLDDPLSGVRAAVLVGEVAAGQIAEYATAARAAGRSWDEVAAVLGVQEGPYNSRAEVVFGGLIEHRPLPVEERNGWGERSTARWTCGTCGGRVTDSGPFEGHPADNESGHADTCARMGAEVAAYRRRWGW